MEFRFRFRLQTALTEFRRPCNPLVQISSELMLGTARGQREENSKSQPTRKAKTIIKSILPRVLEFGKT